MKQKWWLIAAGVVGIGLAVLLFPRPDTGGDVPAADPTNTDPLDFKEGPELAGRKPGVVRTPDGKVDLRAARRAAPEERLGPNPLAAELAKRRSTPEAVYAGRASGPWTIVRRQLLLMKDDADAQALAEELAPLITGLRGIRRDPESADYGTFEQQQKELLERVRANEAWLEDEVLVASIERVDGILVEYHESAAEGASDAPTAADDAQE